MSWIEEPENSMVGTFDLSTLNIDEAFMNVTSFVSQDLWLYSLTSACYSCPFTRLRDLPFRSASITEMKIDTTFPTKYRFRTDATNFTANSENDAYKFCDFETEPSFGEFGVYNILMYTEVDDESPKCSVTVAAEQVNIYLPFLPIVAFYGILAICMYLFRYIRKRLKISDKNLSVITFEKPISNAQAREIVTSTSHQRQRLKSLDTFRGVCILVMIFGNFGGGRYTFFQHSVWDGITVADLVFPWFLWIMGVCVPIAIKSQIKREISKLTILKNIVIRSAKLIGLGLFHNSLFGPIQFGQDGNLRIPGVLQRFGVCYLICSTLVLLSMTINFHKLEKSSHGNKGAFQDITILGLPWIPIALILLFHFWLTFFLPVPGCPTGYLGPGGLDLDNNATLTAHCIGGAAGYIDHQIFTISHIYQNPMAKQIFQSGSFDPEGALGTLTSIFQVWLGIQTGVTLLVYTSPLSRLKRWGIWAAVTGLMATVLCQGKQTGGFIPVNKNLWSVTYVLVTSCFANILLSVFYFIIDVKKWWTGSPFFETGMNSMLLYLGHGMLGSALPWRWTDGRMRTHCSRLVESLWAASLWGLIGIWLHCKKLYWSI